MPLPRPGLLVAAWIAVVVGAWLISWLAMLIGLPIAFDFAALVHRFAFVALGACGWWLGMLDRHSPRSAAMPLVLYFSPNAIGYLTAFALASLAWYEPLQLDAAWPVLSQHIAHLSFQLIALACTTSLLFLLSRAMGVCLVRAHQEPRPGTLRIRSIMIATLCIAAACASWQFLPPAPTPRAIIGEDLRESFLLLSMGAAIQAAMLWMMLSWAWVRRAHRWYWIPAALVIGAGLGLLSGSIWNYWSQNIRPPAGVTLRSMSVGSQLVSIFMLMGGMLAVIAIVERCGYRLVQVALRSNPPALLPHDSPSRS